MITYITSFLRQNLHSTPILTITTSSCFFFQALGFTESDSAGQTNIFAVEPKQYVAGSSADTGSTSLGIVAFGGVVAVGAIVAGLSLVNESSSVDVGPTGDFLTLTAYKSQFAAELQSAPSPADLPTGDAS